MKGKKKMGRPALPKNQRVENDTFSKDPATKRMLMELIAADTGGNFGSVKTRVIREAIREKWERDIARQPSA